NDYIQILLTNMMKTSGKNNDCHGKNENFSNKKWRYFYLHITRVFWYAVIICIGIVIWGALLPDQLNQLTASATSIIYDHFGWFYMFVIIAMIGFSIYLMFSKY